eukprot:4302710-Pleurochrysis_carterae.AAC.2
MVQMRLNAPVGTIGTILADVSFDLHLICLKVVDAFVERAPRKAELEFPFKMLEFEQKVGA